MRIGLVVLLLPVAACSLKPNYAYWAPKRYAQVQAEPKPYPPYHPDRIDGSYQGTAYLTSTPNLTRAHWWKRPRIDDQVCPHTYYGVIEIGDGTLNYAYTPTTIFAAPVLSDGSIAQTVGDATLTGKLHNGRLTFNVVTPICTTRFFGDYKLNHS